MDRMGMRIKRKREILGLQIKELSVTIGVTSSLISQIERGKAFPSIVTLKKIAEALDIKVGDLIGENDNLVATTFAQIERKKICEKERQGNQLTSFVLSPPIQTNRTLHY